MYNVAPFRCSRTPLGAAGAILHFEPIISGKRNSRISQNHSWIFPLVQGVADTFSRSTQAVLWAGSVQSERGWTRRPGPVRMICRCRRSLGPGGQPAVCSRLAVWMGNHWKHVSNASLVLRGRKHYFIPILRRRYFSWGTCVVIQ